MNFVKIEKKHEFHLMNNESLMGKGFIYEHEAIKFYTDVLNFELLEDLNKVINRS